MSKHISEHILDIQSLHASQQGVEVMVKHIKETSESLPVHTAPIASPVNTPQPNTVHQNFAPYSQNSSNPFEQTAQTTPQSQIPHNIPGMYGAETYGNQYQYTQGYFPTPSPDQMYQSSVAMNTFGASPLGVSPIVYQPNMIGSQGAERIIPDLSSREKKTLSESITSIPSFHAFFEGLKFAGVSLGVFVVLFVSSNFSAYMQLVEYWYYDNINPAAAEANRSELEKLLAPENMVGKGSLQKVQMDINPSDYRLVMPKLNINVPINYNPQNESLVEKQDWSGLEESIQKGLETGVVHYPFSSNPGSPGNFFLTGHSSYYPWAPGEYKSIFATLTKLVVGDQIVVFKEGRKFIYTVYDVFRVKPEDTWVLDQDYSKYDMTIMTCGPVGTARFRDIVKLKLTYPEPDLGKLPPTKEIKEFKGQLQS